MKDKTQGFDASSNIDIERLSRLCRISLSESQSKLVAEELTKMADYTYLRLNAEDSALPFYYPYLQTDMRDDIPRESDIETAKLIIEAAPSSSDGYVAVPKVIKGESEK